MTKRRQGTPSAVPEFQDQALKAMPLPPAWITAKQLYWRMDVGSFEHVKRALQELLKAGKICKFGPIEEPAFRRIDLPEFKPDKEMLALIRQYQRDLAEWKER